MGLEVVLGQNADPRLYNQYRDVAHIFKWLVEEAASRIDRRFWKPINRLLDQADKSDMSDGVYAIGSAFVDSASPESGSMEQALNRHGWEEVSDETKIALMTYIGMLVLGVAWDGYKSTTLAGVGPAKSMEDVKKSARNGAWAISGSPGPPFDHSLLDWISELLANRGYPVQRDKSQLSFFDTPTGEWVTVTLGRRGAST